MTKFGQAEFAEFLAELFMKNKIGKILETEEKKNFSSRNAEYMTLNLKNAPLNK